MAFTSTLFILFAILVIGLYFAVPKRMQWWVLLGASYLFYLAAGVEYLFFILYTTLVTYLTSRWMQSRADREDAYVEANRETLDKAERKAFRAKEKKKRFRILIGGLLLGFGMLAVLKYTGFAVSTVSGILTSFGKEPLTVPSLLLPLGISFYTFQSMGYLIDVYRKTARAEKNPARLALFISFFPQLIQGPISRFSDLSGELFAPHDFNGERVRSGLLRVLWGYFKKLVMADTAMIAVKALIEGSGGQAYTGAYVFLLILLYSVQIYGDFTGGIDITIGLSEIMGIRLKENFNRPFSSRSTKEYWRRWHITMGSWFTDYVFYPMSVTQTMQRFSKWSRAKLGNAVGKRLPVYAATIATWFLTGLWHGAGWNFIVWGLLNCLVILVSQELQPLYDRFGGKFPRLVASRPWEKWQMVRTFLLMGLIRSLDCYRDVGKTFSLWWSMITDQNLFALLGSGWRSLGLAAVDWILLLACVLLVWLVSRLGKDTPLWERLAKRPILCCLCACALFFVILIFGAYGIGYDASQFIYNQF